MKDVFTHLLRTLRSMTLKQCVICHTAHWSKTANLHRVLTHCRQWHLTPVEARVEIILKVLAQYRLEKLFKVEARDRKHT